MKDYQVTVKYQGKKQTKGFVAQDDAEAYAECFRQAEHLQPVSIRIKYNSIEAQLQAARRDVLKRARA